MFCEGLPSLPLKRPYTRQLHDSGAVISVPQKFYGEYIKPGSVTLTDDSTSATFVLKDDSRGNLYDVAYSSSYASRVPDSNYSGSLVGNVFLDPVYQITHNTEIDNGVVGNSTYDEHNYYYYRGTSAIDFRAKNIESFDSIEKNAIDLYASLKSLYLQDRAKKVKNSESSIATQNDSDWEEIDTE